MNMKRTIGMVMTMSVGFAFAADVTYKEPPADTAMIKVAGGTTTVAGLEAYSHLTHYWSFDDESNPYADSIGNLPLQARSTDPVWKSGDDAKRGGAMWTKNGFKTASNFIDGKHPFTICFWYKYGNFSGSQGQESLLHIGKKPKSGGKEISDTSYLRVSHHNTGSPTTIDLWNNQVNHGGSKITDFTSGNWHHIALVCTVVEAAGCVTSNRFTVYRNGSATAAKLTVPQQDFAVTDNFLLGTGYHYGGSERPVYDATFDEVMCFDKALTSEELKAFADYSSPVDFSAGWNIMVDGTLDIFGRKPLTALKGEGVAKTMEGTRLEASSNAWFAGSVQSPAFTFAGESSVTQTLSGANAWTGATTVESGTLEIAASPVEVFGDALVAWYPFEDAANPGRDFSPRGNHLTAQADFVHECTESNAPFAGAGRVLSVKGNTAIKCLSSSGMLKGFVANQDNSFTVSFWMRTDSWNYDEGPFQFATTPATGLWAREKTSIRAGDTGNALSLTVKWGDEVWRHWVMIYDAEAAAKGENCYFIFINGVLKLSSSKHGDVQHATKAFYIGRSLSSGAKPLDGAMDEFIVLNTANTDDVAKLYALRREQSKVATGVLPTGTTLTIEEGATLKLSAANETVRRLSGKGTIDLSGNSKLTVTKRNGFEGTVIGGEITDGRPGIMMIVR